MGSLSVTGVVVAEPSHITTGFPGASRSIPIVAKTTDYAVESGGLATIDSPSAFVDTGLVGAGSPVTAGLFLIIRTEVPLTFRSTVLGVTHELAIDGLMVIEFSAAAPLSLLEVQGSGRFECLVVGQV
jgi:hypothetical protein